MDSTLNKANILAEKLRFFFFKISADNLIFLFDTNYFLYSLVK